MSLLMPALIGHRGVASEAPENTAIGLKRCKQLGIKWVELDVTLAGDGSLVMMHDETLERFRKPTERISKMDREALLKVDAGEWFSPVFAGEPLLFLDQAVDLVKTLGMGLNLEIKINPDLPVEALVDGVLATEGLDALQHGDRLVVSSFDHQALARVAASKPEWPLGALYEGVNAQWRDSLVGFTPYSIHTDFETLTDDLAADIRSEYPLYCYTVNDPITFKRLLDKGVNGVFSDRAHAPDLHALITHP
ncbi:glycerophosphodiester phosphodiesterase family protein [Saccharospirillum impatiens]|uniref:glycerophosphodiester phosphodiesterase family protein n=1 Tax=Saccharospirillum impatiens TaxID=169438 RepID=UPI0004093370|nr:glycerophosphodiester phosphodiesterase family protein [Saccharospirillum impatiens]